MQSWQKEKLREKKWLTLTLKNFPYLMQWVVGWQMLTSELSFSDDNSWLLAVGRPRCWAVSGLGVRIMGFTPSYPLPPGTLFTCLVEEAKNGGGGRNGNWLNKGKVQSWNFTYLTPGNHGLTYLLFWEVEKIICWPNENTLISNQQQNTWIRIWHEIYVKSLYWTL